MLGSVTDFAYPVDGLRISERLAIDDAKTLRDGLKVGDVVVPPAPLPVDGVRMADAVQPTPPAAGEGVKMRDTLTITLTRTLSSQPTSRELLSVVTEQTVKGS
jgi:hypothetical protein